MGFSGLYPKFKLSLATLSLATLFACGGSSEPSIEQPPATNTPIQDLVPDATSHPDSSALYKHLTGLLLERDIPDVTSAVLETKKWANDNLPEFPEAFCAFTYVMNDADFSVFYGHGTLGVTFPWMQIYIRDGRREDEPFLWKDVSLFVSTVLHEHVHAIQRARQARKVFQATDCVSARNILSQKRSLWNSGFDDLRSDGNLNRSYSSGEQNLLRSWTSPIQRAKDEVEASLYTVRWMNTHPQELNAVTKGGLNNWVYGLAYLNQLRILATEDCFSPDERTYQDELRIYREEVPAFVKELSKHEIKMREYIRQNNLPLAPISLAEMNVAARPAGRSGAACNPAALLELPRFPLEDGTLVTLDPVPIDSHEPFTKHPVHD